jgi:hypothetical protein
MDITPEAVRSDSYYGKYSEPDPEYWCPECIKDANTVDIDERAVLRLCQKHKSDMEGDKDNSVSFDMQYPGMVAGGQEARDLCNLIHGDYRCPVEE